MMAFDTIQINAFAGLKERTISLHDGLNILQGENESGKSTAIAFLRWILYGYPTPAEKKRLKPLSGEMPSGSLTLTWKGEQYRIVRKTSAGGRDQIQTIRLSDCATVGEGMEPGEYFFGISREVFDQTALVRQGSSGEVDGKKLSQSINNMLSSADEHVSIEKAIAHLEQARVGLWYVNRKGGRIAEQSEQIDRLRARLRRAQEGTEEILDLETVISDKKNTLESHKAHAEEYRLQLLAYRVAQRREKEELLARRGEEWKQAQSDYRAACDAGLSSGFVPDSAYRETLHACDDALRRAEDKVTAAERALAAAAASDPQTETDESRKLRVYGGAEEVLDRCRKMEKKCKTYAILGALLAIVLVGIIFLILRRREKKKLQAILQDFGVSSVPELEELAVCCRERHRASDERIAACSQKVSDCRAERQKVREQAESIARRAGLGYPDILTQLAQYDERLSRLAGRAREAKASYESMQILLEREEQIECDTALLPSLPQGFDAAEANRNYRLYSGQIPLLEKQIHAHQLKLTELNATREDPAAIAEALSDSESLLRELHAEFDAVVLAIDSLRIASEGMRDSMTGVLAFSAAGHMKKMTAGRFGSVGVDADFSIHTPHPDQDGVLVSSDYLSEGTRNQAYLSLRLALTEMLCGENQPPLLLDEALVYLDDQRLQQVLDLLKALPRQTLLFTASGREKRILARLADQNA